jgi:DNA invertase Pin-like site-specific DNA recombinase
MPRIAVSSSAWGYGRTDVRGENSGMAILNNFEASQIRDLRNYSFSTNEIAVLYGVSRDTVYRIWKRKSYVCA